MDGSWTVFAEQAPALAAAGRRLLVGADGVAIGFLATVSPAGAPHLAPACPIFCGDHLYLSASARSVKPVDLRANGGFVLHAFLGEHDEELQVAGTAQEVMGSEERGAVHEAIPFGGFDPDDPIFRLGIERALWVSWERIGQSDTHAVRRRWHLEPQGGAPTW